MTVRQAVEYIEAFGEQRRAEFRERAVLLNNQAQQIVSGVACFFSKKARFLELKRLYPTLFDTHRQAAPLSPEEAEEQTAFVWKTFLLI